MSNAAGAIAVRAAVDADRAAILDLLASTLQWVPDELFDRFFSWKHETSPFGRSPAWVATDDDRIIGYRTFVRWEFEHPDGRIRRAVRAVDTATHPDAQGRGVFTRLTLHGIDELRADGVDFVFNTPNDQSRPGYLKMGWQIIGRPPVRVRPRGLRGLARLARSRVPAEKWSEPATFGQAAAEAFAGADLDGVAEALTTDTLATNRTPTYLRWRYGFAPLHYRVVRRGDDLTDGFAVVRLRHRGAAVEGTVCELVVPGGDGRAIRHLLGQVEGADYLLVAGRLSPADGGLLPAPHQGPQVTWRALNEQEPPALRGWTLSLGDLELF